MLNKGAENLHISAWSILKFFIILLALGLIYATRDILISLFFAVIIASALEPAVKWLERRKIPRIPAVIIIYLTLVLLLVLFVYLILPLFFEDFSSTYPALQKQVLTTINSFETNPFLNGLKDIIAQAFSEPYKYLTKFSGGFVNFASGVFGGLLSFIVVVIFSFYLATQERGIENFLRLVTPISYEPYVVSLWERSQRKLGRWLQAQILLGAIVGVFVFFGLTFMGVEHALLFALISAVFEIIPVVGPILGAVPAVITAFLMSPLTGLMVIALYVVVQQMESHVIVPVVMRKTIGLSPLIVVLALLVGAKLGGIAGIILSVPITAILAELIEDWDKKKRSLLPGS